MQINITYDASTANAPSAFFSAIAYVVNYYDSLFTNPITVNIAVGYGEVNDTPLTAGNLGASVTKLDSVPYSTLYNALATVMPSAALPASDPTTLNLLVPLADESVLGLTPSVSLDGYVGFSSSEPFTYTQQAVPGEYDFIGTAEHEISEVLGRVSLASDAAFGGALSPLDLYRYASPGTVMHGPGDSYFSLNRGVTALAAFNNAATNGGDSGDWASTVGADSYRAFSAPGVANPVSPTDWAVMAALGYTLVGHQTAVGLAATTLVASGENFLGAGQDSFFRNPSGVAVFETSITGTVTTTGFATTPLVMHGTNVSASVNGSNLQLQIGVNDTLTVNGGGDTILTAAGSRVIVAGTNHTWDNVTGTGLTVTIAAAALATVGGMGNTIVAPTAGAIIGVTNTNGDWDTVAASGCSIVTANAQTAISGGGNAIAATQGDCISIANTNGNWDYVAVNGGLIVASNAQATIGGGGNAIWCAQGVGVGITNTYGNWDYVAAADGSILVLHAQTEIGGGGNAIWCTQGDSSVGITNTYGEWDYVAANGCTVVVASGAQTIIGGGEDAIWCGQGSSIIVTNTNGAWDNITGSGSTMTLTQGTQADVNLAGGSDIIQLGPQSELGLAPIGFITGGDTLSIAASGNTQSVGGFNGQNGDRLDLRSILGAARGNLSNYMTVFNQGANTVVEIVGPTEEDTVTLLGVTLSDAAVAAIILPA